MGGIGLRRNEDPTRSYQLNPLMKRLAFITWFILIAVEALAQGTLYLSTTPAAIGSNQRIYAGCDPMSGPHWVGQLSVGLSPDSLTPVGVAAPFLTGLGAGYWRDLSTTVVPLEPGSIGFAQLRVWESAYGSTWEQAMLAGSRGGYSGVFVVRAGGDGEPPSLPGNLTNFKPFWMLIPCVPEPDTLVLSTFGLATMAVISRRRNHPKVTHRSPRTKPKRTTLLSSEF